MTTAIIYAHPYDKSFNHAILNTVLDSLRSQKQEYELLDLYADGFNPVYTKEELALFSQGQALDPLVQHYQEVMKKSSRLIFIYPIWWNDVPAIVKGFFDKVFLKEFAYRDKPSGLLEGLLPNLQEAIIFSTSAGPTWYERFIAGNASKKIVLSNTLKSVGVQKKKWFNVGRVNKISDPERQAALKKIAELV
ncbi:NAD(P)H-dependent oxidoreductase [Streptococcus panodentis]|uniref:NAD(P)H dehydrogenase n=1 Tax=Streptococcus panodentis TaxID=1581472 RepID=A0ABS5AY46_9STRE|nr:MULTISPECIES: NAD(P)H-dependent oxidoreductase [Streptococcus]KXT81623.1 NAD(P)H oxidoreductase YRKL / putative NADPH-quinone reductase / Flavodoxin 2 [Streptococcus sp. DD11]MBP2621509.1 NAD(P)H dehydrogenase [Streptococcus panodentis]